MTDMTDMTLFTGNSNKEIGEAPLCIPIAFPYVFIVGTYIGKASYASCTRVGSVMGKRHGVI